MKILSAKQIREVDNKTLINKNITSQDLMYMAQDAIYQYLLIKHISSDSSFCILCGVGNNGGDGMALAISLHAIGVDVKVYIIEHSKNYSSDFYHYLNKANEKGLHVETITTISQMPSLSSYSINIDAIFGTGLNREITGLAKDVISKLNRESNFTISIDIPSGLMLEKETTFAVRANESVTLQIPKLALFLPSNYCYTGEITILNFGLCSKAIDEQETTQFYMDEENISCLIKPLNKYAHKGTQGHSLIIGGSIGKIGSVSLASKAALKSGCGLVSAYIPKCGTIPIQSYLPEAMAIEDDNDHFISNINYSIMPNAIGIGVGMGNNDTTRGALIQFIRNNKAPLVIDADAINIISDNIDVLKALQPNTILTPHPKELSRLIGGWDNDFDKITKTTNLSKKHNIIIVIKGAHSLIITPKELFVNNTGTPALATAGSGDVLTGIITGLLAQGYTALQATKIGVYLHGLTANMCADKINLRSFTASDIIDNIGDAYFKMEYVQKHIL